MCQITTPMNWSQIKKEYCAMSTRANDQIQFRKIERIKPGTFSSCAHGANPKATEVVNKSETT